MSVEEVVDQIEVVQDEKCVEDEASSESSLLDEEELRFVWYMMFC